MILKIKKEQAVRGLVSALLPRLAPDTQAMKDSTWIFHPPCNTSAPLSMSEFLINKRPVMNDFQN